MEKLNSNLHANDVIVIGLGFVGLTLSLKLSEYIPVIGIEKDNSKFELLKSGEAHFYETGIDTLLKKSLSEDRFKVLNRISDLNSFNNKTIIITIGTPVVQGASSSLKIIELLLIELDDYLRDGDILIFRSTISVGTTDFVFNWFKARNKIIHTSFCPERTIEGNAINELSSLPQIISGTSQKAIFEANRLFSLFCSKILLATSTRTAELAKLASNIERDVYFSFANELGFIAKKLEIDYSELKKLVSTDYPRSFLKEVGPIAGPCLEKDTYILKESFDENQEIPLISLARKLNEKWIIRVADEIVKYANSKKFKSICVTGLAFKGSPPTDDLRGSLALPLFEELKNFGLEVFLFDPSLNKEIVASHFCADKNFVLNDWDDVILKTNLVVIQNGSKSICQDCLKYSIDFLDITTFNSNILEKKYRIF